MQQSQLGFFRASLAVVAVGFILRLLVVALLLALIVALVIAILAMR